MAKDTLSVRPLQPGTPRQRAILDFLSDLEPRLARDVWSATGTDASFAATSTCLARLTALGYVTRAPVGLFNANIYRIADAGLIALALAMEEAPHD